MRERSNLREIGSEFWNVPLAREKNSVFPETVQWYLSGRSALQAIIGDLKVCRTVALPSWCCDSMIKPFTDAGFRVRFYPVFEEGAFAQKPRFDCDVLYVMDYFGFIGDAPVLDDYRGVVICDMTLSVFSGSRRDADYYFGSLRKWCGVWTGGYAWTENGHALPASMGDDLGYTALREQAMQIKNRYINRYPDAAGRLVTDKTYLQLFNEAEEKLEKLGPLPAAERDIRFAGFLNEHEIRTRRRENAGILMGAFPEWLVFPQLRENDCPLFVPIIVPDGRRNDLRKYLMQNEIYCPVHWPVSSYHKLTEKDCFLYENELSLVCDQRYGKEDMERLTALIRIYWEEHKGAHGFNT